MKIVIAPQAFKGCASAQIITSTIAAGVHRAFPDAHLILAPVADGGDDTLDILLAAKGGERHLSKISGALEETKTVYWGALTTSFPKTAIIESARICGLATLDKKLRNPLMTTTYGIGELIDIALEKGYRRLFIGLGGSATNDGGTGLAQALGVRFLDANGRYLPKGGGALTKLKSIDISKLNPLIHETEIIAGCDVTNPLLGITGASYVYSPQKGATQEMTEQLEEGLENFARIVKKELGKDIFQTPRAGAAGGTAAGLSIFCQAKLVSGAQWILNEIGFDKIIENADFVITGEGCIDFQTSHQKAPLVVAEAAKKQHIPVIALAGTIGKGTEVLKEKGIEAIFAASPNSSEIPPNTLQLLQKTAEKAVLAFFQKSGSGL